MIVVSRDFLINYFAPGVCTEQRVFDALLFTCDVAVIGVYGSVLALWMKMMLSFVTVKHAELILYGKSTSQSNKEKTVWYEKALLVWHSIKLPKAFIITLLLGATWIATVICFFCVNEDSYSNLRMFTNSLLVAAYFVFGSLLCLYGIVLFRVLHGMGAQGDARRLRNRIISLSVPASVAVILRGVYFLCECIFGANANPVGIALLGIFTENFPCLLLLILMWPIPKPGQVDSSLGSYLEKQEMYDIEFPEEIKPDEDGL